MLYQHLDAGYQQAVLERWSKLLDAGTPITSPTARLATAMVLENTQREFDKKNSMLTESYAGGINSFGGMGAGAGTNLSPNGGGAFGTATDYGPNDSRIPTIVVPTIRRLFPELIAHDVVGVQPMTGPVGFAFAVRNQYGVNNQGVAGSTQGQGTEMGYNFIDSRFTGASGLIQANKSSNYMVTTLPGLGASTEANSYWQAFAGATGHNGNGMGATQAGAEWWKIGQDMPMTQYRIEKGVVTAETRKLAAHWSLEHAEDMISMHGLDVDAEMTNVMSYEVKAELDRQLLGEMVKACIVGGSNYLSTWSPVSADGRNQLERIGTIYTQVLVKSQAIAINSRRGPATFAVASPTVIALLERLGSYQIDRAPVQSDHSQFGVAKVGNMHNSGMSLYRDTFAGSNYILLGHKGPTPYDTGIIFCPYIPLQLNRAIGPDDFSHRIGLRTRYGILSNLFGSANYYQMIKVDGLTNTGLVGDSSSNRVFIY
jgi:hypothetical protein